MIHGNAQKMLSIIIISKKVWYLGGKNWPIAWPLHLFDLFPLCFWEDIKIAVYISK